MRKSLRQDFILVDSICGDLTLEDGGDPVRQDRLIAAADPVLCDTYECSILEKLNEKIAIGQGYHGKRGELGIGNCTSLFRHSLPGCPPTEGQMTDFLRNHILKNVQQGF